MNGNRAPRGWTAIWALARAEMRQVRRLARYWVFVVLALLFSIASYLNFWFLHHFISGNSASAAALNPRYFIAAVGGNFLFLFLFGLIFLSFDIRARDRRERIHEVLDSRPHSNLELVFGRALGILIVCWIPVVVTTIVLGVLGTVLKSPIEPRSLWTFVFFMSIPAYVFTMGLVYVATLVMRNRLVASLFSIAVLVLLFFGGRIGMPFYYTPVTDVSGAASVPFPSDLHGSIIDAMGFGQRLAWLVGGVGLLWLAAAIYPRRDDASRSLRAAIGVAGLVVGAAIAVYQVSLFRGIVDDRRAWRARHDALLDRPAADLRALRGEVVIQPGRDLDLDLRLSFAAPPSQPLERAQFTLNPGLRVAGVSSASGGALVHSFADGLLEVELTAPLAPGAATEIALAASGRPDPTFGYVDSAIEFWELTANDAAIALLGFENLIFDADYVALLPETGWLPTAGPLTGRSDPRRGRTDFFEVDLTFELPAGWLAAGPGQRQDAGAEGDRVRYRFAPPAPLPQVALVAGRFESFSAEVEGVQLELLVHPSHTANVELFADAVGEIEELLAEPLREARDAGLDYPYGALTMVEIPVSLRGYGGGWRMDTTLAQPAMVLLRESSFPTAKYARYYDEEDELEELRDREGGVARAKREQLETFFEGDLNGGNPFLAASRNFVGFQTAGSGPEALSLDYVFEILATQLLTGKQGFFSVHLFDSEVGQRFQRADGLRRTDPDRISDNYARIMANMLVSSAPTWEGLLETSLTEIDPWSNPELTIHMLELKGRAMAQSLLDYLGHERAGRFLAALRDRARGGTYGRQDVLAAGVAVGEDLGPWLEHWIDQTDLPGFVLAEVQSHRLERPAEARGTPSYQTLVTVANEQGCPGLLRVDWVAQASGEETERGSSEPVYVPGESAVEVGIVTAKPPRTIKVVPYLSLNRGPFAVTVPPIDEERPVIAEPFAGSRPVAWQPPAEPFIVVDDLDDGFRVEETAGAGFLPRLMGGGSGATLDRGLPVNSIIDGTPSSWSRRSVSWSFGHYRRTHALVRGGQGDRLAVFTAELPRSGEWELEFFLPKRTVDTTNNPSGKWKLEVEHPDGSEPLTFDAEVGQPGWNSLGRFELAAGEVSVRLSNETEGGRWVAADAIRWKPAGSEMAQR
jgi:ABC-type transport system involved in multi-copper enzyme maturation permease subunit